MKKIYALLLIVTLLLGNVVFAESLEINETDETTTTVTTTETHEISTDNEELNDESFEEKKEHIKNGLKLCIDDLQASETKGWRNIIWRAMSDKTQVDYSQMEYKLNDTIKNKMFDRIMYIYSLMTEDGILIDKTNEDYNDFKLLWNKNIDELDHYAEISLFADFDNDFNIFQYNQYIAIYYREEEVDDFGNRLTSSEVYKVNDPQKFIDLIADISSLGLPEDFMVEEATYDEGIDLENEEKVTLCEKVTFDVKIDDDNCLGVFKDVAQVGETVNASIEYIQFINEYGRKDEVFIITFEGSKGKKQYWSDVNSGLGISVSNQHVFEENAIKRKAVHYLPTWNLFIKGDGTENTVTEIYFTLNYEGKTISSTIIADNVNYVSYLDIDEWHWKNELHSHFVYIPKVKPEVEDDAQGDPNHKVSKFREYDTNGGLIRDYTVDYLAEASFDIDAEYAPEWYQELGDNVKVILMGVTRNFYNINKQTTETFIRLQGDDGYLWFEFTQGTSGTAGIEREDQIRTDLEWASLVSFDGETMISDTEGYDVMYTSMFFTKDEVLPLEKIEFTVGSEKVTLQVDDFNCIGDSDSVYYFGRL